MTILATFLVSLVAIGIHYEALRLASSRLLMLRVPPRLRVAIAVMVAIVAHIVEVVIFAITLMALIGAGAGTLSPANHDADTVLYFSFACYTSLGFGDIIPEGSLRIFAGVEALIGLVMIGWTASFTYLEMRMYWLTDKAVAHDARGQVGEQARLDG